jgi:glyoxylase-like metal-dependent hydrolase (beta-lactamase superfamily II)
MKRTDHFVVLALLAAAIGCTQATPEQQVINDAAAALGGRGRLLAVRTLIMEGTGTHFNLGQDMRPDVREQKFEVTSLTRRMDVQNRRSRIELTRLPRFAYFQGQAEQRQLQGIDSDVAYNIGANGSATRVSDTVARDRRADFHHHPVTIVRAAMAPKATVRNVRTQGAERLVDVTTEDGFSFVLAIDGAGLPARVESRTAHANLGDVTVSTLFATYQQVDGLNLPTSVTTKVDDFTTAELEFTKQQVDTDVGDLAAPPAAVGAVATAPAPPNVVPEVVAPGIWLLAGQSHHSALVEMSDHLLLIDAPQSEARTLAVIRKARELQPGKPLTKLITTHHHFDHTAGVRAAIAEGLTIVTHSGNRAFFEQMARRPHTILPDALAKSPKPVSIEPVDDEFVIKDAARTLVLYHVADNPHSDTMLMVYFPAERVLVQVDAFSPGAQANPYAPNLLENILRRKLRVDRIVPLHGPIAPFAELVQAAKKTT